MLLNEKPKTNICPFQKYKIAEFVLSSYFSMAYSEDFTFENEVTLGFLNRSMVILDQLNLDTTKQS